MSNQDSAVYAGFWRRFAAFIFDIYMVSVISGVICVILVVAGQLAQKSIMNGMVVLRLALILSWLYWALLESSSKQATLGKMVVGIIVSDSEGKRISFGRASARYWSKFLSSLLLYIGFLMAGWTRKKQAFHDIIANTLISSKDSAWSRFTSKLNFAGYCGVIALTAGLMVINFHGLYSGSLPPALRSEILYVYQFLTALAYASAFIALCIAIIGASKFKLLPKVAFQLQWLAFIALFFGIIFRAIWAVHAWGQYWNWDPKEVWSLFTLFIMSFTCALMYSVFNRFKILALAVQFAIIIFLSLGINSLMVSAYSFETF